jgi:transposase
MCPAIDNPASCKIRAVIRFLHTKNMSAAEIHRELCAVSSQNVMSEGTIRQWCTMFKYGRTNIQDKMQSGQLSVVSDDQKICEKWCFIIS